MYRIHQVKLELQEKRDVIPKKIETLTGAQVKDWVIRKESVDARDKGHIQLVYTVDFDCDKKLKLDEAPDLSYKPVAVGASPLKEQPVIVGFGPCGIFAALILAEAGCRPIVLERGKALEERVDDVNLYWKAGTLNEESNVQFGEGGAGTFSDGKLTTGIKDVRIHKVLREFVEAGGSEELLYKQKPHIGTDVLRKIVVKLRQKILSKGGQIRFGCKVADLQVTNGQLSGVTLDSGETLAAKNLILAIGHSARDTFRILKDREIAMEQKPFSIGVRIEHPQALINKAQYGNPDLAKCLGPADYKLSHHCKNGRGVYTFCMCPGGEVIMAASQKNTIVTNGMSCHDRNGEYANSGLLVDVRTTDFPSEDVLAGVDFQQTYESLAFKNGGGNNQPPKVTWGQFKKDKNNPVASSLPAFAVEAIAEAMPYLARRLRGFDDPQATLTAVESRSSSPVRILRNKTFEANVKGLFPAGEGAGYAGGIMSAAVDGIKVAEQILRQSQASICNSDE